MTGLAAILVVGLVAASMWGWFRVVGRLRRGEEPVPYVPRRPVPWPGTATLLVVILYLLLQGAASTLVRAVHDARQVTLPATGEPADDPSYLLHVLQGHAVACVLVLAVSPIVLKSFASATTLDDVGFDFTRLGADLRLGVVAFFVIVPPVLLIQLAMSFIVGESRHPLVEGWKRGGGPELLLWTIVGAVVAAPTAEEFLFRGVLQGWFEWLFAPNAATSSPSSDGSSAAEPIQPAAPPTSWTPIVGSSALFASAHLGNGPDPVPIFFLALGLGYLYRQTHRVWPGIVVHLLLNAFSTAVLVLGIDK